MKLFIHFFFFAFILLFLTSCEKNQEKELKITTNSWIGYAPIFYANEIGALKNLHITLITNVSLAESVETYKIAQADFITATQHEYYSLQKSGDTEIVPFFLFDRSFGGDIILGNKPIQILKNVNNIDAFLEIDSINAEIIESFLQHYHIDIGKVNFINKDQAQIAYLEKNHSQNMIVVTYVPYNFILKKNGFLELASTKTIDTIIVIDALFGKKELLIKEKKRIAALTNILHHAIEEIQKDPQKAYKLIAKYLNNITYEDFMQSLTMIKWIDNPSVELLQRIEPLGFKKEYLK